MTDRCLLTSIFKIYIKFPFFWYIICLVPKVSNNFNLSHGQYSSSFLWPNVSNFDNIYFTFIVTLLTVTMTHWRNFKEKSRRNFKETPRNNIPRERICFNERDTNKLVTAKKGRKSLGEEEEESRYHHIKYSSQWWIPQEEQHPGQSWQFNNLVEPSNDENSNEKKDGGTTYKICNVTWKELTENAETGFNAI